MSFANFGGWNLLTYIHFFIVPIYADLCNYGWLSTNILYPLSRKILLNFSGRPKRIRVKGTKFNPFANWCTPKPSHTPLTFTATRSGPLSSAPIRIALPSVDYSDLEYAHSPHLFKQLPPPMLLGSPARDFHPVTSRGVGCSRAFYSASG